MTRHLVVAAAGVAVFWGGPPFFDLLAPLLPRDDWPFLLFLLSCPLAGLLAGWLLPRPLPLATLTAVASVLVVVTVEAIDGRFEETGPTAKALGLGLAVMCAGLMGVPEFLASVLRIRQMERHQAE